MKGNDADIMAIMSCILGAVFIYYLPTDESQTLEILRTSLFGLVIILTIALAVAIFKQKQ